MRTNEFIDQLTEHGQFSTSTEAREATRATLVTMSEMLTEGESHDLASQLPDDLYAWVVSTKDKPSSGARFGTDEFVDRIADRIPGGADPSHAEQQAHLVLTTLRDAVSDGEWEDLRSQLPDDFGRLLN